jgi:hypothetical protein
MATYYVTVNRPAVEAATPEEAAQKALSDPLGPEDVVFVKEIPVDGSVHAVPGGAVLLGGVIPNPDEVYEGGPVLKRRN